MKGDIQKSNSMLIMSMLLCIFAQVKLVANSYGTVVSREVRNKGNTIIERIALQVPEHCGSSRTIMRNGVLIREKDAIATIMTAHGFMTTKEDVQLLRLLFPRGKYNFMSFDFRAHGEGAAGQRCTFGRDEACEVITAAHFIKNHDSVGKKPIILYAFSMGAVASIEAQAKDPSLFTAMILDCPFDSSETIIKSGLNNAKFHFFGYQFNIPAREVLRKYVFHPYVQSLLKTFLKSLAFVDIRNIDIRLYPVNTAEVIPNITVPVFFIHCKNDEKVPMESVVLLYERVGSSYKKLWKTNGRGHFDSVTYNPEEYSKEISDFVEKAALGKLNGVTKKEVIEDKPDKRETKGYIWGIGRKMSS